MSKQSHEVEVAWVELASRREDGLYAVLQTLGSVALSETPARVYVSHQNGVYIEKEGPLQDVAPIYKHPMLYVSSEEARTAYPAAA